MQQRAVRGQENLTHVGSPTSGRRGLAVHNFTAPNSRIGAKSASSTTSRIPKFSDAIVESTESRGVSKAKPAPDWSKVHAKEDKKKAETLMGLHKPPTLESSVRSRGPPLTLGGDDDPFVFQVDTGSIAAIAADARADLAPPAVASIRLRHAMSAGERKEVALREQAARLQVWCDFMGLSRDDGFRAGVQELKERRLSNSADFKDTFTHAMAAVTPKAAPRGVVVISRTALHVGYSLPATSTAPRAPAWGETVLRAAPVADVFDSAPSVPSLLPAPEVHSHSLGLLATARRQPLQSAAVAASAAPPTTAAARALNPARQESRHFIAAAAKARTPGMHAKRGAGTVTAPAPPLPHRELSHQHHRPDESALSMLPLAPPVVCASGVLSAAAVTRASQLIAEEQALLAQLHNWQPARPQPQPQRENAAVVDGAHKVKMMVTPHKNQAPTPAQVVRRRDAAASPAPLFNGGVAFGDTVAATVDKVRVAQMSLTGNPPPPARQPGGDNDVEHDAELGQLACVPGSLLSPATWQKDAERPRAHCSLRVPNSSCPRALFCPASPGRPAATAADASSPMPVLVRPFALRASLHKPTEPGWLAATTSTRPHSEWALSPGCGAIV